MRYSIGAAPDITIQKLSADEYVDLRTGEVKEFQHTDNRAQSKSAVSQSLRNLRDLINSNLTDPETVRWVTLTYRENMADEKRLYEDWRRFWQRFKYYLHKRGLPTAEYIIAAEPQARGAWHLHCLFIFPEKAPYIHNSEIARIWGNGFTKTKSLRGISNPGLYLTAYLGDMELTEAMREGMKKGQIKEVTSTDERGKQKKKAVNEKFRLFWNEFHSITQLPKENIAKAQREWKKLSDKEQQLAIDKVEDYYFHQTNINYLLHAASYLSNKAFLNEY